MTAGGVGELNTTNIPPSVYGIQAEGSHACLVVTCVSWLSISCLLYDVYVDRCSHHSREMMRRRKWQGKITLVLANMITLKENIGGELQNIENI